MTLPNKARPFEAGDQRDDQGVSDQGEGDRGRRFKSAGRPRSVRSNKLEQLDKVGGIEARRDTAQRSTADQDPGASCPVTGYA